MHTTVAVRPTAEGVELRVASPRGPACVSFRARDGDLDPSADAALAATLLAAMRMRTPLTVEGRVSPRLAGAVGRIEELLTSWAATMPAYGRFAEVPVTTQALGPAPDPGPRPAATFFTGGVDSFYTLARRRAELHGLVYVHGFDVPLDDGALRDRVTAHLRAAAAEIGLPLVEVETDLRSFTDPVVQWTEQHGAALAAVAHLCGSRFARVHVPATLTDTHLIPLGSHPQLDPLWSSESVELVHDGGEASRLDKLAVVAEDPVARAHLRVCWENRDGRLNCGRCEKCLRTMVAMEALDVLDRFTTFPSTVDPALIARVELPAVRITWEASLERLRERGGDPTLVRALERRLHSPVARAEDRARRFARRVGGRVRRLTDRGSVG